MSSVTASSEALITANKMVGAGIASGPHSLTPSRAATPPVISSQSVTSSPGPTVLSTAPTPFTEQATNALLQLVKISKMNRSRATSLAEKPEVQVLLDKDIFLIQSDRRTKMNSIQQLQLLRCLAQFFQERVDDGHRYAYFEAIFLGRADDPILHEYRLSVMFQLVSFSLQYPVLQFINHVMSWICQLRNEGSEKLYSDRLLDMIIDHFVNASTETNQMYRFLMPLADTCSEFCALFIARAPIHGPLNPPMIELLVKYCNSHIEFMLRHLRDTSWLGNDFAEKVFPKLVDHVLTDVTDNSENLVGCICYILNKWNQDVLATAERKGPTKRIEVLDLILSPEYPWTDGRVYILRCAVPVSNRCKATIQKQISRLDVPDNFKLVIDDVFSEEAKTRSYVK
uniref:SOSS complex subunit A homolog n=1 Tax=Caenorhabditis tropicalis TaxID=1561998 RepID=A0A1I7SXI7_9PELO